MSKDEPAFPVADTVHPNGQVQFGSYGMTLRDYFAAKAMQAYMTFNGGDGGSDEDIAQWAYEIADAMIEARK